MSPRRCLLLAQLGQSACMNDARVNPLACLTTELSRRPLHHQVGHSYIDRIANKSIPFQWLHHS
jgi:hypothetical protein